MPSVIFSYTHSAHEGAAHKHPPAVSRHIFPRVTYALVRSPCKNAPFLALGHFFAVRLSATTKRCGEPPQADYSAKKAILQYCPVTSQIIMGGAPRAPAESKAFYNPTYTHILCFTVKCVLLGPTTGTDGKRIAARNFFPHFFYPRERRA